MGQFTLVPGAYHMVTVTPNPCVNIYWPCSSQCTACVIAMLVWQDNTNGDWAAGSDEEPGMKCIRLCNFLISLFSVCESSGRAGSQIYLCLPFSMFCCSGRNRSTLASDFQWKECFRLIAFISCPFVSTGSAWPNGILYIVLLELEWGCMQFSVYIYCEICIHHLDIRLTQ